MAIPKPRARGTAPPGPPSSPGPPSHGPGFTRSVGPSETDQGCQAPLGSHLMPMPLSGEQEATHVVPVPGSPGRAPSRLRASHTCDPLGCARSSWTLHGGQGGAGQIASTQVHEVPGNRRPRVCTATEGDGAGRVVRVCLPLRGRAGAVCLWVCGGGLYPRVGAHPVWMPCGPVRFPCPGGPPDRMRDWAHPGQAVSWHVTGEPSRSGGRPLPGSPLPFPSFIFCSPLPQV